MKTIMCMGDSITKGPNGGYRRHLAEKLAAANVACRFVGAQEAVGQHEGYPGFGIRALLEGRASETYGTARELSVTLSEFRPDILLLMLGTNDLYIADPAGAFANLKQIIDRARTTLPQLDLYVASILPVKPGPKPWNMTVPDDVTTRIPEFNGRIAGYVAALRDQGATVHFVDIYRVVASTAELGPDGVHPPEALFERIAQIWLDALLAGH
jgi:lysophospholipase L1-like esterase